MCRLVLIAVLSLARPAAAAAVEVATAGARLWAAIDARVEASVEPRLVPPIPVAVTWMPRRLGDVELDAPLLGLAAADLDGDGVQELIGVTSAALVTLSHEGEVVERASLPAAPAVPRPRSPVGVVLATGEPGAPEVHARVSAVAVAVRWRPGGVVEADPLGGFPLCEALSAELVPGRYEFDAATVRGVGAAGLSLPPRFVAAACGRALVDPAGAPVDTVAVVEANGALVAWQRPRCVREPCDRAWASVVWPGAVGDAVTVGDLDRDGRPELATSAFRPPGEGDVVEVRAWIGDQLVPVFRSDPFDSGVAALTLADIDGDGALELVVAVRAPGQTRVTLWGLNR